MSSRAAKLAELRALRAAGKKRLSTYQVEEQDDIYEEVDDEGYKKIIRDRLDQDDFVVDDQGEGYADDGREVWNERTAEYESDSDELPSRKNAAKRKRDEEKQHNEKMNISKYFYNNTAAPAPKPKASCNPLNPEVCYESANDQSSQWLPLKTALSWPISSAISTPTSYRIRCRRRTSSSRKPDAKSACYRHPCLNGHAQVRL